MTDENIVIINSNNTHFNLGLREVWEYRELLFFFAWKQIKTRYKQTSIGVGWAVLQPLFTMVVFTIIFGHLANLNSEGYSYEVFVFSTLILWTYFSTVLTQASMSLVNNANMISKVYFPRLILPISFCLAGILDFGISAVILFIIMAFEHVAFSFALIFIFVTLTLTFLLAAGLSFWLSAMSAKYRDIQYVTPFFTSLLMFATPIIYSWNAVTDPFYQFLLTLNPLTGIMITQRELVLNQAITPDLIIISTLITLVVLVGGILYFKKYERQLADVI